MAEFEAEADRDLGSFDAHADADIAESDPASWVCGDDNGYIYYYNNITGKSVWEKPVCLMEIAKRGFARQLSSLLDENITLEPPPLSLRIFHQFDRDNSGYIDVGELQTMAYHFGVWLSGDALHIALMIMDRDGNGEISYEEFLHWYKNSDFSSLRIDDETLERRSIASIIFKRHDLDNSGSIDKDEFAGMYAEMISEGVTSESLEAVMAAIDVDNDGHIQFNEFTAWLDKCVQPIKTEI